MSRRRLSVAAAGVALQGHEPSPTLAAERLAREDRNEPKDEALESVVATLRKTVRHYFASPPRS